MLRSRDLSPPIRYDYSDFWLAIINRDVEQIKAAADKLGVGELYGLFACMVTARYISPVIQTLSLRVLLLFVVVVDLGALSRRG